MAALTHAAVCDCMTGTHPSYGSGDGHADITQGGSGQRLSALGYSSMNSTS